MPLELRAPTEKELSDFRAADQYDDEMRSRLMDMLVIQANGDAKAFQAAANILLAGWFVNYQG